MANFMDFSTSQPYVYELVVDTSGSMGPEVDDMRRGLIKYKKDFESFPQKGSIAIAVSKFSNDIKLGDFNVANRIDTSYEAYGATALYYAINKSAKHLENYITEIITKNKVVPICTYVLLSDAEPCKDKMSRSSAETSIKKLNDIGVNTIFVPFGKAISSDFGERLGFKSTKKQDSGTLIEFFDELIQSSKKQSQSRKSLGSAFFSKAKANPNTKEYSQVTGQVLDDDDDDWLNSI